jgi:hypothetical protein
MLLMLLSQPQCCTINLPALPVAAMICLASQMNADDDWTSRRVRPLDLCMKALLLDTDKNVAITARNLCGMFFNCWMPGYTNWEGGEGDMPNTSATQWMDQKSFKDELHGDVNFRHQEENVALCLFSKRACVPRLDSSGKCIEQVCFPKGFPETHLNPDAYVVLFERYETRRQWIRACLEKV